MTERSTQRTQTIWVFDFDGTLTLKDIGDEVCDRFAPPAWRLIDEAWVRREISLPDAQRQMWALARCQRDEAVAYAKKVGHLRPGLSTLLDWIDTRGDAAWLASGGFDFYIEALLDGTLGRFSRQFFNRTAFVDGSVRVEFPHVELACKSCGVCKGRVCDLARAAGVEVRFIGDGTSDRCAIGRAGVLYAVRGSTLARTCDERGFTYVPFDRFEELI